jgi:hypothetical protein
MESEWVEAEHKFEALQAEHKLLSQHVVSLENECSGLKNKLNARTKSSMETNAFIPS